MGNEGSTLQENGELPPGDLTAAAAAAAVATTTTTEVVTPAQEGEMPGHSGGKEGGSRFSNMFQRGTSLRRTGSTEETQSTTNGYHHHQQQRGVEQRPPPHADTTDESRKFSWGALSGFQQGGPAPQQHPPQQPVTSQRQLRPNLFQRGNSSRDVHQGQSHQSYQQMQYRPQNSRSLPFGSNSGGEPAPSESSSSRPSSRRSSGNHGRNGSNHQPVPVDVMYTTESRSGAQPTESRSGGQPTALTANNRRGTGPRELVEAVASSVRKLSIRNLQPEAAATLATAPSSSGRGEKGLAKGDHLANDENRWKLAWDADGDDDDDDEMMPPPQPSMALSSQNQGNHMMQSSLPAVHQPFRPGMDYPHSSATPLKRPLTGDAAAATAAAANAAMNHQHNAYGTQHQQQLQVSAKKPDRSRRDGSQQRPEGDTPTSGGVECAPPPEKPTLRMFFPLLRVLGKGSFGKVVLVQKRTGQERGRLFAMKILRKSHLVKRRQIERTKTERKVLSVADHPFIMKLHYAFQTEDKLYLVLDYCPGGELFFHLSRYRRFPERVARFYTAELLLAIGHLHKKGIIYRDLKPENVLLDAEGHVKLGDFGLAKDNIKHPLTGATSMCGTPEYMAPEVLSQAGHGFCVDYWGLGMLVYEMMTGLPPWYTTDRSKLFKRLKSAPLEIPSYFSGQSASYVSALLERNPRKRLGVMGMRSAMSHEFFRDMDFRALVARYIEAPIRPCEGWKAPEGKDGADDASKTASVGAGKSSKKSGSTDKITTDAIEAATANFDNTFTRMPVDTVDAGNNEDNNSGDEGGDGAEELNESTFLGFTFDETDRDKAKKLAALANGSLTHSPSNGGSEKPGDRQSQRRSHMQRQQKKSKSKPQVMHQVQEVDEDHEDGRNGSSSR